MIQLYSIDPKTAQKKDLSGSVKNICRVVLFSLFLIFRVADIEAQQTTISGLSSYHAYPGSSITITGTNFNTTAANNIVYFGATQATVNVASATSLGVTVPSGATYMPVSVHNAVSGYTTYSQYPFFPIYNNAGFVSQPQFDSKQDFTTGTNPGGMAVKDIDGDGKPDLIVVDNSANKISIFRNTSTPSFINSTSFAAKVDFTTGSGPTSVAVDDIDGDGKPDIVVTNFTDNTISVFRNTATSGSITSSSLAAKVDFATGVNPSTAVISDIDMDGKMDIVTANYIGSSISILRNISTSGSITGSSLAVKVDYAVPNNPQGVMAGDIDGDGKPDIIATNYVSNNISVFRNTSTVGSITNSSLASNVDFTTGNSPISVAMADIDGDGKPDVIASNYGSYTISILRNTSSVGTITSSSLAAKVDFATGTHPGSIAIGDIDGDGKPDIITSNYTGNTISVFRNKASSGSVTSSSIASKVDFTSGTGPSHVVACDMDGDGKPDIAFTNNGSTTVSVMKNDPYYIPYFANASPQVLSICQNVVQVDIKSLIAVNDPSPGLTETWSMVNYPLHGNVYYSVPTSFSGGGNLIPTGLFVYAPTNGYSGPDTFSVKETNGLATDTMVVAVVVNPSGSATVADKTLCNGSVQPSINFGTAQNSTFTWTSSNPSIGIAASGSGNVGSFTAINTTYNPVTSGVTVIATSSLGCVSNPRSFIITVNPTPIVFQPFDQVLCSGNASNLINFTGTVSGTTYNWTNSDISIGISSGGTSSVLSATTVTNNTMLPDTAYLSVTPIANSCTGSAKYFTFIVNPSPTLSSTLSPPAICDSTLFSYAPAASLPITTFNWYRDTVIGISNARAKGTNNPNEILVNTTPYPLNVPYIDTLRAYGCTRIQTVTVTVNPRPSLSGTLAQAPICDSTLFTYAQTSLTTGTTFNWFRDTMAGIANNAATDTSNPNEILVNTSVNPITVVYVDTLRANGCANIQNVSVVVEPKPLLTNVLHTFQVCDSALFSFSPTSATPGTVFKWSRAGVTGISNPPASGSNNPSEHLKNITPNPLVVVYVDTLKANGCSNTENVVVNVNPTMTLSGASSFTLCSKQPFSYTASSSTNNASFAWSRAGIPGITPLSATGTNSVSETLTNGSSIPINVIYRFVMTINGCSDTQLVNLLDNPTPPIPEIDTKAPENVCSNTKFQNFGTSAAVPAGSVYEWTASNATIWNTGQGDNYCLISFPTAGSSTVTLTTVIISTLCQSSTSYDVTVGSDQSSDPTVVYFEKSFVCLDNTADSYQWGYDNKLSLDSTIIAGAGNQNYYDAAPDFTNKFYWVLFTKNGCKQKAYYKTPPAAIINMNTPGPASMKVYPNPATDEVNIELNAAVSSNTELRVSDLMGKIQIVSRLVNNKGNLDISPLAPGVYIIACYRNGVQIAVTRMIKN